MKPVKPIQVLFMSVALMALASCGEDNKKSSPQNEINPICEEIDCLSSVSWKIKLPGREFPAKSRVAINDTTVLDECIPKQKYEINRASDPQSIYLESFSVPTTALKIVVEDLGDCHAEATEFLKNENVNFQAVKTEAQTEIHIDL